MPDEFNPLLHPEKYRADAIKWAHLWLQLQPWIEAGLVNFVRTPGDFDLAERREIMEIQRAKFQQHPELLNSEPKPRQLVQRDVFGAGDFTEFALLSIPDARLAELFEKSPQAERPATSLVEFLSLVHRRRDAHPYYVEHRPGEDAAVRDTTGAPYEEAKRICAISGSHLVTDLPSRWMELALDHEHASTEMQTWSPFAKALHNTQLKVLDRRVPLEAALLLRNEGRLEQMRLFFARVWKASRAGDLYAAENATHLAAELDEKVREAEAEWDRIDQSLLKRFGANTTLLASAVIAGFRPAAAALGDYAAVVGTAAAGVAAAATQAISLSLAQWQRKSFKNEFPAGFFLNVDS
jgi:hypothetical protein